MKEKTVNITNFIGVYDNYITEQECNKAIKLYEDQNKFNNKCVVGIIKTYDVKF